MNKKILIVVPIMALLICVSCLSSGAIGSVSTNNKTGGQGSVQGSLQLNSTITPSVTPSPTETPYYTPTFWRFDPMFGVYMSGYFDDGLNAVLIDPHSESSHIESGNPSTSFFGNVNVCGAPEIKDDKIIAYISENTNSYWGDGIIPKDVELIGASVMNDENCRYEMVWVAPKPMENDSATISDDYFWFKDPIVKDSYVYEKKVLSDDLRIISVLDDDSVLLGCGNSSWDPNNDDLILLYMEAKASEKDPKHYKTKWIAQVDCAAMYDNGNSGWISIMDGENEDYIEVNDFDRWVYLKQVATEVGKLPLDSEEYRSFVEVYEIISDGEWGLADIGVPHYDSTGAAYRGYAIQATEDAEQKNIRLDSFEEYVRILRDIITTYDYCYSNPDCYRYETLDWQLLTTTATPGPWEYTVTPSP